jgi:sarcosine oxidase subunit alpha
VLLLPRATVNGYHDHNFLTIHERLTDHLGDRAPIGQVRHRVHRVRAKRVVLAAGAHERPLVYGNNDVPGNMLAGAVSTYVRRYGVAPGRKLVLSTNNDHAYRAALDWHDAGLQVVAIADARSNPRGALVEEARQRHPHPHRQRRDRGPWQQASPAPAWPRSMCRHTRSPAPGEWLECDLIATSGGYSPIVHLASHLGGRRYGVTTSSASCRAKRRRNACVGVSTASTASAMIADGFEGGARGLPKPVSRPSKARCQNRERAEEATLALFQVPHEKDTSRAPKQFVDLQNDVTAAAIELATREGFESVERQALHRAGLRHRSGQAGQHQRPGHRRPFAERDHPADGHHHVPPELHAGDLRRRGRSSLWAHLRAGALHRAASWHVKNGAEFEDVGQWKRPWYFPKTAKTCTPRSSANAKPCATASACSTPRPWARSTSRARMPASSSTASTPTPGPSSTWARRYGLMCKEDGMVFDDGVTACLADNHFVMTTTTGGAARVLQWLELYHQTEWPELKVYFTSVTDHWATMTLSGPNSRKLLSAVTDIDLDNEAFPFMTWKEGLVGGVPARVFRISFTGELSYEVNVQADYAMGVLEKSSKPASSTT